MLNEPAEVNLDLSVHPRIAAFQANLIENYLKYPDSG